MSHDKFSAGHCGCNEAEVERLRAQLEFAQQMEDTADKQLELLRKSNEVQLLELGAAMSDEVESMSAVRNGEEGRWVWVGPGEKAEVERLRAANERMRKWSMWKEWDRLHRIEEAAREHLRSELSSHQDLAAALGEEA